MSGIPFERPLDFRRDGRRRRDMGALHLETVLVRYPRDTDLLAIRRYIRILALRDDRRLVVHLFRLARFLMTYPVARLEIINVIAIEADFELLRRDYRILVRATRRPSLWCAQCACRTKYDRQQHLNSIHNLCHTRMSDDQKSLLA